MTDGFGADYTFEATGNVSVMRQAVESARMGWGLCTVAGVAGKGETLDITPRFLITGRRVAGSSFGGVKGRDQVPQFVERWLAGDVDVDPFVSHTLTLDEVNRGFELMEAQDGIRSRDPLRLAIRPGPPGRTGGSMRLIGRMDRKTAWLGLEGQDCKACGCPARCPDAWPAPLPWVSARARSQVGFVGRGFTTCTAAFTRLAHARRWRHGGWRRACLWRGGGAKPCDGCGSLGLAELGLDWRST